jgi:hypothetical protein
LTELGKKNYLWTLQPKKLANLLKNPAKDARKKWTGLQRDNCKSDLMGIHISSFAKVVVKRNGIMRLVFTW